MAALTYLDTHVVAWLFANRADLLSAAAVEAIEAHELRISPMVGLELQYLNEIGRLNAGPERIVTDLNQRIGLTVCDRPFYHVATAAIQQSWTRDPFDRVIAAQAWLANAPLVTKDAGIAEHYAGVVW